MEEILFAFAFSALAILLFLLVYVAPVSLLAIGVFFLIRPPAHKWLAWLLLGVGGLAAAGVILWRLGVFYPLL